MVKGVWDLSVAYTRLVVAAAPHTCNRFYVLYLFLMEVFVTLLNFYFALLYFYRQSKISHK